MSQYILHQVFTSQVYETLVLQLFLKSRDFLTVCERSLERDSVTLPAIILVFKLVLTLDRYQSNIEIWEYTITCFHGKEFLCCISIVTISQKSF